MHRVQIDLMCNFLQIDIPTVTIYLRKIKNMLYCNYLLSFANTQNNFKAINNIGIHSTF